MPPVKQLPQPDAQRHTGPPVVHSSYAIAARNAHVDDCDFGARTRDIIRLSADGGAAGMLATVFAEPQTLVRQRETDPVTGLTTSIRGHLFQDVG